MLGAAMLNGNVCGYAYGPDNLRYKKTVNGTETLYYWDGDLLVGEKTGNVYTEYLYDESGIIGMIHDNVYYYFEKNLFGDVLKVCRAVDKFEIGGILKVRLSYFRFGGYFDEMLFSKTVY